MAFSALDNSWTQWYKNKRSGTVQTGSGNTGTALVSDLAANDYLCGMRATIISTGSTSGGNRTLTLNRAGYQWTQTLVAASSVLIIRP